MLKLVSKLLLIAAIALALGRMSLTTGTPRKTLLIVDTTLSMGTQMTQGSRLDEARALAARFVAASDAPVSLCTFDGKITPLVRFQNNKAAILKQLSAVELSPRAATAEAFVEALMAFQDLPEAEAVVYLSDFQAQWYGDGKALKTLGDRLGRKKALTLIPVDTREGLANLGLVEHRLTPEGVQVGRENEIQVQVRNFTGAATSRVPVTLVMDGTRQDRALVSLQPGEAAWVSLVFNLDDASPRELVVQLPPDALKQDNQLHVHLQPRERLNVLAVVPEKGDDEEFRRDVFVKAAVMAVNDQRQWNYKRVLPPQVFREGLENYDLVVLFGVPLRLGDPLVPVLDAYLQGGGGVVSFADPELAGFWSGLGVVHDPAVAETRAIDPERLSGGYLEFMESPELNPLLVHLFRFLPLEPSGDGEARLFVKGVEKPVMLRRQVGRGGLICAGFLPFPGSSDIYYNPNFVQFCTRVLWEGLNWQPTRSRVGEQAAKIQLPGLSQVNRYSLARAQSVPMPLPLHGSGENAVLRPALSTEGGFATILANDEPLERFGHDPSRLDSDIAPASAQLAGQAEESAGGIVVQADPDFANVASSRELGLAVALLLLAALLLESYAHLMRRN